MSVISTNEKNFKFISFSEKISKTNVDLAHHRKFNVLHALQQCEVEISNINASTFSIIFEKWKELDYSDEFIAFSSLLPHHLVSLSQLVHHQYKIVSILQERLKNACPCPCLPAMLELFVALAVDLQLDFYKNHWNAVFDSIVYVLEHCGSDGNTIELCFTTLAQLYKINWRRILPDLNRVFQHCVNGYRLFAHKSDYMRRFAAESFSFLLRKTSDQTGFLRFALNLCSNSCSIENSSSRTDEVLDLYLLNGVARLVFECMRGIQGRLHSKACSVLNSCFSLLFNKDLNASPFLFQLNGLLMSYVQNKEDCRLIMDVLLNELKLSLSNETVSNDDENTKTVLLLLQEWVTYKQGKHNKHLENPSDLIDCLLGVMHCSLTYLKIILNITEVLLRYFDGKLSAFKFRSFVQSVLECCGDAGLLQFENAANFVINLHNLSFFNVGILSILLQSVERYMPLKDITENNDNIEFNVLQLLSNLLNLKDSGNMKSTNAATINERYVLRFSKSYCLKLQVICSQIINQLDIAENFEHVLAAIVVLPNLDYLQLENVICLHDMFEKIYEKKRLSHVQNDYLLVAFYMLKSLAKCLCLNSNIKFSLSTVLNFTGFCTDILELRVLELYLVIRKCANSCDSGNVYASLFSLDNFIAVFKKLEKNFASSSSTVRSLSSKILANFELKGTSGKSLFDLIMEIELLRCNPMTYRDKIRLLQSLRANELNRFIPEQEFSSSESVEYLLKLCALRTLIAQLFTNFALLWPFVAEFIESHARAFLEEDVSSKLSVNFLEVLFNENLLAVSERCEIPSQKLSNLNYDNLKITHWKADMLLLYDDYISDLKSADYANFRFQLLQSIERFADLVESRSRFFVPLFLRFIANEYSYADYTIQSATEDLSKETNFNSTMNKRPIIRKTLICYLAILSKFKNLKALYQEPKVTNVLFQLLLSPRNDVQRAAMKCVLAYNFKWLSSYSEHFVDLLDPKKFKDELVLFGIDPESTSICDSHRKNVVELLLRVLYGKLKSSASIHSVRIMQYLAGCQTNELVFFLDLMLAPLEQYLREDLSLSAQQLQNEFDLRRAIPLRKLLGMLNALEPFLSRLPFTLLLDFQQRIFNALALTAMLLHLILKDQSALNAKAERQSRLFRQTLYDRLVQYFLTFDSIALDSNQSEILFKTVVLPWTQSLTIDCNQLPVRLVRLFDVWSRNRNFGQYFMRKLSDDRTLLSAIVSTLQSQYLAACDFEKIINVVRNLLDLVPDHRGEDRADFSWLDCEMREIVPAILLHFEHRLNTKQTNVDLSVLPKLVTFLSDDTIVNIENVNGENLARSIIRILQNNKQRHSDIDKSLLEAFREVFLLCKNNGDILCNLAPLFSIILIREHRALLCDAINKKICVDQESLALASIVINFNAFDKRFVDEPDYVTRLKACDRLIQMLTTPQPSIPFHWLLIYTHCFAFSISNINDIALRDCSTQCLCLIVSKFLNLVVDESSQKCFLNRHLLPLCKGGIRSKSEQVRHEFLIIIRTLITAVNHGHLFSNKLNGMAILLSDESEEDFFENIRHLQLHRRSRALRRLSFQISQQNITLSTEVVCWFVLPLVSHFLFESSYAKNENLHQASIELIGILAAKLPWFRYFATLQFYLRKMILARDNRKLLFRAVVAILDAFHFDVGNPSDITIHAQSNHQNAEPADTDLTGTAVLKLQNADFSSTRGQDNILATIEKRILIATEKYLIRPGKNEDAPEKLQAPLCLCLARLLKKMPVSLLNSRLPSLCLKLCQMLKSRSYGARQLTRKTLIGVVDTLGPEYLFYFLREMRSLLTLGYQRHVCSFSMQHVFQQCNMLNSDHLRKCLPHLLPVCQGEIIGQIADEKEIEEIRRSTPEARSRNVMQTYRRIGQLISIDCIEQVVNNVKEAILSNPNAVVMRRSREVLKNLSQGLACNSALDVTHLMIYAHQLVHSSLDQLLSTKPSEVLEDENSEEFNVDCTSNVYLIQPSQGRFGPQPRVSKSTSLHVLTEFAVNLLMQLVKLNRLQKSDSTHLSLLDPFVGELDRCISTGDDRLITASLQVLWRVCKHSLPALQLQWETLVNRLFMLAQEFMNASSMQSQQLRNALFKTLNAILKSPLSVQVSSEQLKTLLFHAEREILDAKGRQTQAFVLLRSIILRAAVARCEELQEVMNRVREMSVASQQTHVRLQCRQTYMLFLMKAQLSKAQLQRQIEFLLVQLNFEHESGRQSALETLLALIGQLKPIRLRPSAPLIFVHLAARLANEPSVKQRHAIELVVNALLKAVSAETLEVLWQSCLQWLRDGGNQPHRLLGAMLVTCFAKMQQSAFQKRLIALLSAPDCLLLADAQQNWQGDQPELDSLVVQQLSALLQGLLACPEILRAAACIQQLQQVWDLVVRMFPYPHGGVRLCVLQLFGALFEQYSEEELQCVSNETVRSSEWLLSGGKARLFALCQSHCFLLRSPHVSNEAFVSHLLKNLVFLGRVLRTWPADGNSDESPISSCCPSPVDLQHQQIDLMSARNVTLNFSLSWLGNEVLHCAQRELRRFPTETVKRCSALKWFAAMLADCSLESVGESQRLIDLVDQFLPLLHRELQHAQASSHQSPHQLLDKTDTSSTDGSSYNQLVAEVFEIVRSKTPAEKLSLKLAECQKAAVTKRNERKRLRAQDAVLHPEKVARRQMKRHKRKLMLKSAKLIARKRMKMS